MREKRLKNAIAHVCAVAVLCVGAVFAAEPTITVSARQRYPWNGLVDVHFTITGDAGTKYDTSFTAKDMVGNTNIAMRTIRKADGTAAAAKEQLLPGTYKWVWDAAADLPKDFKCDRVTVTGTANEFKPLYMVIDLSGGANASSYPVSYLDAVPDGGWTDEYKTTKLVLRRIEPGTFMMCGQYSVTLTNPYYIGVFEVTQKQWELVKGDYRPYSVCWISDMFPAMTVSYNELRGSSDGAGWPDSIIVDTTSFIGQLRTRMSGLLFDLPTEAQWEYACRAGTTSDFNNGGSAESDLNIVGRYTGNSMDPGRGKSETDVGSYLPNEWGLYDMHGNVQEWCLDWYGNLVGGKDPKGAQTGTKRVLRGGDYSCSVVECTSSYRSGWKPNLGSLFPSGCGFRLCLTLSE